MSDTLPRPGGRGKPGPERPRGYEAMKALAAAMGVPIRSLVAMSKNCDPFYAGTEAQLRDAKWFASLWERFEFPRGVHLRRIHYRLVSEGEPVRKPDGGEYENTEGDWVLLVDGARYARHLGLVDPEDFEDRRNPSPHLFAEYPPDVDGGPAWDLTWELDSPWKLPRIGLTSEDLAVSLVPDVVTSGYDYGLRDQPYHLEVWIEKSTQNDVLIPVCRRWGVNLVTGVGYQSITGVVRLLRRLSGLPDDRPSRIFYVSDFDPAGDKMPVAVAREIEFHIDRYAPGRDVKLTPVALTEEQVKHYRLPRIPIKDSDLGKASFEDRRGGKGGCELDALEALYPGELARLVEEAVKDYRDPSLEERMQEAAAEAQEAAQGEWEAVTASHRERLERLEEQAGEIVARYRERTAGLDAELQAELRPLRDQLEAVRRDLLLAVDDFAPSLPARPEPEVGPPEEGHWLYDSARDYLEQLRHYRSHNRVETLEDRARACPVCGRPFTPRRSDARMCSDRCRSRAYEDRKKAKREKGKKGRGKRAAGGA
jgi:hypothetical protein